jgi:hypothetical protein
MRISCVQIEKGEDYIISEFWINNKKFFMIEDPLREVKIKGITGIERGIYKVIMTMSNRFKKIMPLLLDVPDFKGVRIHSGNTELDSEGCLIIGSKLGYLNDKRAVLNSKDSCSYVYSEIQKAINKGEDVTIELI